MDYLIKSKSDGLDLFNHVTSVYDTACIINRIGNYGLDNNILYWSAILHDLGKANPLFQSKMNGDDTKKICRHEISSLFFIDIVPEHIREIVGLIVLSHHKSLHESKGLLKFYEENTDNLYKNHITDIDEWGKLVKNFLSIHYNIDIIVPNKDRCVEIIKQYVSLIKKLDKGYSMYRGIFMMSDHFASCFPNDTDRLEKMSKLFDIPNISCYNGQNVNYPLSLIDSDNTKKHTFVIAPTGCGKTNFMMKRTKNRIFYMLPYQASINAMYNRFKKDIGDSYLIGLKHSSFKSLSFLDEETKDLSNFFGLPVKIITPFQIMSICLSSKGYESIIMDLKGQDVILDEIHTYKDLNQTCILHLINVLKYIGCRIHICTATIPTLLKEKILDILGVEETQIIKLEDDVLNTFNRHTIHLVEDIDIELIKEHYNKGDKILIVKNQVKAAQKLYKTIKDEFETHLLIHSRFKRGRRAEIEKILINDLNTKKEPCIVISTQVVEVSIDINFDVMFTDCADIMALIQRFGRINRQRNNIGVYKDVYIIHHSNNSYQPYDKEICDKTYEVLSKYNDEILIESNIQSIIDEIHNSNSYVEADIFNPLNGDEWKIKKYYHNEAILANLLEFKGYIGIVECDIEEYKRRRDSKLEVPLSQSNIKGLTELEGFNNKGVYVIPNHRYSDEYGFV